ncbi:MAG: Ig-like domain-containing protein [Ramlibacter sp.]|nr:Ig-like domain-containing protein [Ramlibacter sp.]
MKSMWMMGRLWLTVVGSLGLVACGGGSSSNVVAEPVALVVTSATPAEEAMGVSITPTVEVAFSRPVQASSITNASVVLRSPQGVITATASLSSPTGTGGATVLRVAPNQPLAKLTRYELVLSNTIVGTDGARFMGASSAFTTLDRDWQTARQIAIPVAGAAAPTVTLGPNGDAQAVWMKTDITAPGGNYRYRLWASHYAANTRLWGLAKVIDDSTLSWTTATYTSIYTLAQGGDSHGNVTVVSGALHGYSPNPSPSTFWVNRFDAAADRWAAPIPFNVDGWLEFGQATVDAGGNAWIAWSVREGRADDLAYTVRVARYTASTAQWGEPVDVPTGPRRIDGFKLLTDGQGNLFAKWTQEVERGVANAWVSRYDTTQKSWENPVKVSGFAPDSSEAEIAFDGQGNAIAMGRISNPRQLWVSQYSAQTRQWSLPETIDVQGTIVAVDSPRIAVNEAGDAVAMWGGYDDQGIISGIWVSVFQGTPRKWSLPKRLDDAVSLANKNVTAGNVTLDQYGNALVLWSKTDYAITPPAFAWRVARYVASTRSWISPVQINNASLADPEAPFIGSALNGDGLAVWRQGGEIWFNSFR